MQSGPGLVRSRRLSRLRVIPIWPVMTHHITTREGLPPEMRSLLRDLPRDGWQAHPAFARGANRVVQLATLEPAQMAGDAGPVRDLAERLNGFLHRHLSDEEDLVVPILLHHRLRA